MHQPSNDIPVHPKTRFHQEAIANIRLFVVILKNSLIVILACDKVLEHRLAVHPTDVVKHYQNILFPAQRQSAPGGRNHSAPSEMSNDISD